MSGALQVMTSEEKQFLHTIRITYEKWRIKMQLHCGHCDFRRSIYTIKYQQVGNDTQVVCCNGNENNEILLEEKKIVGVFCDDLEELLLHIESELDWFEIQNLENEDEEYQKEYLEPICAEVNEGFARILRYRNPDRKLKIKEYMLEITKTEQVTSMLPYLDPETVVNFRLYLETSDPMESLAEVWDMDFWKIAGRSGMYIHVRTLYPALLIGLKEAFIKYSYFGEIKIEYNEFEFDQMKEIFGEPNDDEDWKLPIPNADGEVLRILSWDGIFFRREKDQVFDINLLTGQQSDDDQPEEIQIESRKIGKIDKSKHAINVKKVFQTDLILKNIVEHVEFDTMQKLRKVSHNIRQCMERIKPDPSIKMYEFKIINFEKLNIKIGIRKGIYYPVPLEYQKNGNGCDVHYWNHERRFIPEDFRTRILKDFEINIKYLTAGLDVLKFDYQSFYPVKLEDYSIVNSSICPLLETFEQFFKSRTSFLNVRQLKMHTIRKTTTGLQQNEVMKVLPVLDSNTLETIEFLIHNDEGAGNLMEVDKISKLSQWMNAKELDMMNCIISTPIQEMNITHFAKGDITVQTISLEDLRYLKKGFQNSSTLEKFKIAFKKCTFHEFRNDAIYQFMGVPHVEANPLLRNQRNIWFCRTPHDNFFLHILHYVGRSITFTRVELSSIPKNVRFQE